MSSPANPSSAATPRSSGASRRAFPGFGCPRGNPPGTVGLGDRDRASSPYPEAGTVDDEANALPEVPTSELVARAIALWRNRDRYGTADFPVPRDTMGDGLHPSPRTPIFPLRARGPLRPSPVTLYPLQEWEGFVTEIGKDSFEVRLLKLTAGDSYPRETANIPLEEISRVDAAKMGVGSIFRWVIGYRRNLSGTKERVSMIVFQTLPGIRKSELRKAEAWARDIRRSSRISRPRRSRSN